MRDGILVLYKPQNWTSSDCVAVCRRALGVKGVKKVGHGGTLDPMATGVLPVFVGQATRIMEYTELDSKTYICAAKLGVKPYMYALSTLMFVAILSLLLIINRRSSLEEM